MLSRWRSLRVAVLTTSVAGVIAATASAQNPVPEPPSEVRQAAPGLPPEQDVFDLVARLRGKQPDPTDAPGATWDHKKPMLSILPTFGAKPSTGFAFGVAANLAVYFGEPATTPILVGGRQRKLLHQEADVGTGQGRRRWLR